MKRYALLLSLACAAGASDIWTPRPINPAFVQPGGTIAVEVHAASTLAAGGWTAAVANAHRTWPCTVTAATTGNIYHSTEAGWKLTVRVGADVPPELLDLRIVHSAGENLASARAVSVVKTFEESFYILQMTDTHLTDIKAQKASGESYNSGNGTAEALQWAAPVVNLINPRFVMFTGDNVHIYNNATSWGGIDQSRNRLRWFKDGLAPFGVPTPAITGNHDIGYSSYVSSREWRDAYEQELGQRNFSWRMGSFHVIGQEFSYDEYLSWARSDYAAAWSDTTVKYRLVTQHFADAWTNPWTASTPPDLVIVGHNHSTQRLQTTPFPIVSTATNQDHQKAAFFRFDKTSAGWTCSQATTHAEGVNVHKLVGDWGEPKKVAVAYAKANDGTQTSNTATITNSLSLDFTNGRVRFLMAKGTYAVTGGSIEAAYDDAAGAKTIVLVKVNIAKSATTTVTITRNQTTVAPAITTQPVNLTVTAGQTATFTVAATGTPAPTYQWQKNNATISGATSTSYTTPATASGDHGATFRCVVTNSVGSVTSNVAMLTVNVAPAITTQPASQTKAVGQTATFSVAASGRPTPTWQWQRNGTAISGATSASYTTPALTAADHGAQYRCVATNSVGTATSSAATITMSGIGWQGSYYDNKDFTGTKVERTDLAVDFDWGTAAPMGSMGADTFSVRWRGRVTPAYSQTYTFTATCDDGVRVWVGGKKVIDRWTDSGATATSGLVNLTAGTPVLVVMEYYENAGSASAKLVWQSSSQAAQTIPHTAVVPATGEDLPGGWTAQDVGTVGLAGGTTEAGGTWTLTGSGADIWNAADGFRFVWQQVSGDVRITAQVASLTASNPWSKAGVMVRESLATGARHAFTCVTPGNGVAFQRRLTVNAASSHTAGISKQAPYWVRLERIGAVLIGSSSPDGTTWTEIRRETIALGTMVYVGMALTSHDDAALATAGFSNVQITAAGNAVN